ncbi:MbnP family protein [uncultured Polaribacter sp.]|uniref:MbnP family protein n=1 Tax=uncultured Polaribacter sp. TaxID=174711 RepID=UPI00260E9D68|nr:MbnP family protein [uncultured Polaribacter sp.]
MKILKYLTATVVALTITACSSNETEILEGEGSLTLEFDNAYKTSDLLLKTTPYKANETEQIKISKVKYIVSNVRLETSDGTVFTYPKNESYFIVNEEVTASQFITLNNIPEEDYTKLTFGIGVDQEKYLEGATGQGDFLSLAKDAGMMWSWQAGYKFMVFEGVYTSTNTVEETAFAFHMGSHGSALDNYKEVTLDLTNSARVRVDATPEIHVVADVANILQGNTKFMLDDAAQIHVDGVKSPQIATNVNGMFTIDHVHN